MTLRHTLCVRIDDTDYNQLTRLKEEYLTENTSETVRKLIRTSIKQRGDSKM